LGGTVVKLPVSASLTIGGVDLVVRSHPGVPTDFDLAHQSFLVEEGNRSVGHTAIDIEVAKGPAPADFSPVVFESGGAWNMQARDEGYRLNFVGEGSGLFHTVACCSADSTRVMVYVDQDDARLGPVTYPLDQLLLMNHLASQGGVIVHSAGVVMDGRTLVFAGVSGAGKSTIARLFIQSGLGESLLSDDRLVMRVGGDQEARAEITAWGTPWPGDAGVARNACAPLAAILFLVKSEVDKVVRLSTGEAARSLVRVASCPWYDAGRLPSVLDTCSRVIENTPCYQLHFRAHVDVVGLVSELAHELGAESA
jgi:hypothetical protein